MSKAPVIQNLDGIIRAAGLGSDSEWVNKNLFVPQGPARVLMCGESASGKTNLLANLLLKYLQYDRLWIFAKTAEVKYDFIAKLFADAPAGDFVLSNDLADLPPLNEIEDRKKQTVVVFDDMLLNSQAEQKGIQDYYIRGRKHNMSLYYLAQTFHQTPLLIRRNCDYSLLWAVNDSRALRLLAGTFATDIDAADFIRLFREATRDRYQFLYVDVNALSKRLKYRKGFTDGLISA